jgi:hypothetical protein
VWRLLDENSDGCLRSSFPESAVSGLLMSGKKVSVGVNIALTRSLR